MNPLAPHQLGVGIILLDKEKKHVMMGKRLNNYRAGTNPHWRYM